MSQTNESSEMVPVKSEPKDFMKVYIKEEVDSDTEVKEESEEVGGFDWKYSCLETEIKEENSPHQLKSTVKSPTQKPVILNMCEPEGASMNGKKRSKNFNDFEKSLILQLVRDNITIIENKKTDAITVKAKEKTWEGIALTFNQVAQTGIRTPNQLHALYLTLKKKAKKDNASDRIEMYKTGGGTYCPAVDAVGEKIISIPKPQFVPVSKKFDSTSALYSNNEIEIDTDTKCHTVDLKKLGDTVESSDTNTSQLVGTIGIGQNSFTSVAEADTNTTPTQATRPVADSTAGASKRKCVAGFESDLDDTISKRKNVKPDFDKQLFKRKMEILDLEMKTKKNQFKTQNFN